MAEVDVEVPVRLLQKLQAEQILQVDSQRHLWVLKQLDRLQQALSAAA